MGDDDDDKKKEKDDRIPFIKSCLQAAFSNVKADKFSKSFETEDNMCVCACCCALKAARLLRLLTLDRWYPSPLLLEPSQESARGVS